MADYEVKLRVDADAEDAKRDLDDIEAKGQRVKRSLSGGGGGGGKGPRATGREMGDELGKVAGRAIGKAVAGFIAHQVSGLVFEGMRTHGGDNTNVNRAESTVGGALQGGTMGAMVGGPWGAAIGAVLGGVLVTERIMPGVVYQDHGARTDTVVGGNGGLDRGGANNLICPTATSSSHAFGEVTSGFLVGVEKVDVFELAREYPEAFGRDYDAEQGLTVASRLAGEEA